MLKRKIYKQLLEWKNSKNNECLMIKGARQVGKSYIVEYFGKKEYKSFIEINFVLNPEYKEIFKAKNLNSENIISRITAYVPNANIIEGNTLIFLDEIQKCSAARTALKNLAKDKRFDVICSGSLLGLSYGQDADLDEEIDSIPVGFERELKMYSMDFEEFLWSLGYQENTIAYLKKFYDNNMCVDEDLNSKYEELFREFIVVGGMPEVVDAFSKNHNFFEVQAIQEKILSNYNDDIANHAKGIEKLKVRKCYESLPRQLAKENKKFQYSVVEKGKTSRNYLGSIQWLIDATMVNVCYNVYVPEIPLLGNEIDDEFKLYVNDSGLLSCIYGMETKLSILKGTIKGNVKGGIYENVIGEQLIKNGFKLHYFKQTNNTKEIEFLIEKNGEVLPIEVKAGNNQTVSLNAFNAKYNPSISYKLISGNLGIVENKKTIPHYMSIFIN